MMIARCAPRGMRGNKTRMRNFILCVACLLPLTAQDHSSRVTVVGHEYLVEFRGPIPCARPDASNQQCEVHAPIRPTDLFRIFVWKDARRRHEDLVYFPMVAERQEKPEDLVALALMLAEGR